MANSIGLAVWRIWLYPKALLIMVVNILFKIVFLYVPRAQVI